MLQPRIVIFNVSKVCIRVKKNLTPNYFEIN